MTTSGTTTFNPAFTDIIEEAFERAGVESRSGYDMRTARRSINIMLADWANRGVNLWTVEERSQVLTYNVGSYTLGTDIVDVIEQMVQIPTGTSGSAGPTRYNLARVSLPTQAQRTNPQMQGRPTEVWFDRTTTAPVAHVWPLPGSAATYTMYYWVLRRMDDAGAYTNTADIPFRFLPAFIAGLAFYVAQKKQPGNKVLIDDLEMRYEAAWQRASDEDREKATLTITPRGSSYRMR